MDDTNNISPTTRLAAHKAGAWAGILLIVWFVAFSILGSGLSSLVYWTVLVGVGILIAAVPSWHVGQRARREYLAKHTRST